MVAEKGNIGMDAHAAMTGPKRRRFAAATAGRRHAAKQGAAADTIPDDGIEAHPDV